MHAQAAPPRETTEEAKGQPITRVGVEGFVIFPDSACMQAPANLKSY